MKLLKYISILIIICGLILGYNVIVYANKPETIATKCALELVSQNVPCEAKYQGDNKNQIEGITTLYYSYKNATHIVKLYHTENNLNRKINWNEVLKIEYE
ncbi:hypothetical protein Q3304_09085 [Clostridioides sp. GD02377]|uniref:hypothetical protein n=1 Tax=unclassified Clostridioides TaxID=2635829 RepID=UPI0038B00874